MTEELSFGLAMFKEKIAEPDLGEMGLIFICCIYLFYCVESFSFEMEALPYFGKTSTSKLLPS
jgi:hypothetical protein